VNIERLLKQSLTQDIVAGYEPSFSSDTSTVKAVRSPGKPRRQQSRRRSGSSGSGAPRRAGASTRR
jgi:ATP-dependent RNA helicase RhlE